MLKNNDFKKQLNKSKICDENNQEGFQVLAMNADSQGNAVYNITHVSFNPGVTPGTMITTYTNPYNSMSQSVTTLIQNNNNAYNEYLKSLTFPHTSNKISFKPILTTIWRGIKWAGKGLINLFKSKGCKCNPNPSSNKYSTTKKQVTDDEYASCCADEVVSNELSLNQNTELETIEFQFEIPLPDSLFENSNIEPVGVTDNMADCECKLNNINIETADEHIKQEIFDCACANDNSNNIAAFLLLDFEQTSWLAKPENKTLRDAVCKFVKDNYYSLESIEDAKSAIEALMNGINDDKVCINSFVFTDVGLNWQNAGISNVNVQFLTIGNVIAIQNTHFSELHFGLPKQLSNGDYITNHNARYIAQNIMTQAEELTNAYQSINPKSSAFQLKSYFLEKMQEISSNTGGTVGTSAPLGWKGKLTPHKSYIISNLIECD